MKKTYVIGITYAKPGDVQYFIATDTIEGTLAEVNSEIEKRYSDQIAKGLINDIRLTIFHEIK